MKGIKLNVVTSHKLIQTLPRQMCGVIKEKVTSFSLFLLVRHHLLKISLSIKQYTLLHSPVTMVTGGLGPAQFCKQCMYSSSG